MDETLFDEPDAILIAVAEIVSNRHVVQKRSETHTRMETLYDVLLDRPQTNIGFGQVLLLG